MQKHTMSMGQRQFRIGDLANELKVKKFVIRFWEQEFGLSAERSEGGHRFYTSADLQTFQIIKDLLHNQGYTIEGARKQLPLFIKEIKDIATSVGEVIAVEVNHSQTVTVEEIKNAPSKVTITTTEDILTTSAIEQHTKPSTAEISIQPAVEALVATVNIPKHEPKESKSIEGAHVDQQEAVRTCHHEEVIHAPAAPCTTCEKHSRYLALVKDELEELVKRLR